MSRKIALNLFIGIVSLVSKLAEWFFTTRKKKTKLLLVEGSLRLHYHKISKAMAFVMPFSNFFLRWITCPKMAQISAFRSRKQKKNSLDFSNDFTEQILQIFSPIFASTNREWIFICVETTKWRRMIMLVWLYSDDKFGVRSLMRWKVSAEKSISWTTVSVYHHFVSSLR